MDLSKLPRLSKTDRPGGDAQPEPSPDPQAPQAARAQDLPPMDVSAEVWLSALFGVIFLLVGRNFAAFMLAKLSGRPFHTGLKWTTGPRTGTEVGYFELQGMTGWTETAIFLFGLAMVFDALILAFANTGFKYKKALLGAGLLLSALAAAFNAVVAACLFGLGITPLMSLIVVAIGGYMVLSQWRLFAMTR